MQEESYTIHVVVVVVVFCGKGGKKIQKRVETRAHLANSYILTKFIKGPGKAVLGTKLLQIVPETTHRSMPMFKKAETAYYSLV